MGIGVENSRSKTLPRGENDEKPKRNCLNCEHLGEDWTCHIEGHREIGNPFEDRADCGDWKPAETTLGLIQTFPLCTPEYENLVQETVEKALAEHLEQGSIGKDDPIQKGNSSHQKTQKSDLPH